MILVQCSGCGCKLNVKEEYAGRKAKCPKCGTIIVIPAAPAPQAASQPAQGSPTTTGSGKPNENSGNFAAAIEHIAKPTKLEPLALYLLLNGDKLVGVWKIATGWQVKSQHGMVPARSNAQAIPGTGSYTLIELYTPNTDDGKRLKKLSIFKLGSADAGKKIAVEPQLILSTISGYGTLTKGQKTQVLDALKENFMRDVWGSSAKIREFLTNFDAHSHVIEE